jgi:hypothetical protein
MGVGTQTKCKASLMLSFAKPGMAGSFVKKLWELVGPCTEGQFISMGEKVLSIPYYKMDENAQSFGA